MYPSSLRLQKVVSVVSLLPETNRQYLILALSLLLRFIQPIDTAQKLNLRQN